MRTVRMLGHRSAAHLHMAAIRSPKLLLPGAAACLRRSAASSPRFMVGHQNSHFQLQTMATGGRIVLRQPDVARTAATMPLGRSSLSISHRMPYQHDPCRAHTTRLRRSLSSSSSSETAAAAVSPGAEPREHMDYDVVVVGGGPAGLAAAIRLKLQGKQELPFDAESDPAESGLSVCVVEKGAEIGSHILSGNVFNPRALDELLPGWRNDPAINDVVGKSPVNKDQLLFLADAERALPMPVPPSLHNEGNFVISLGALCRALAERAEELGVEIFPGFAGSEVLYDVNGAVSGIATSDMGLGCDGRPKDSFERGYELRAKHTLFAEGCRGSLSESVMDRFALRADCDPQTYAIGLKEVWEVPEEQCQPGFVLHTLGWPVPPDTWSGSFLYHAAPNRVLVGLIVALDYENPYLNPYREFQRMKHHPSIAAHLKGGKCVSYGARALNEGGFQSLPKLTFPGGSLIGCSAGFLNVPKLKGTHYAMKSGMIAADSIVSAVGRVVGEKETVYGSASPKDVMIASASSEALEGKELANYAVSMSNSWVFKELKAARNVRPSKDVLGFPFYLPYSALETYVLRGHAPWTFRHKGEDWQKTKRVDQKPKPIDYPKPDGVLSFDLLTNLQRSGVNHAEDQPIHLTMRSKAHAAVPEGESESVYAAPETRFCPAAVYEYDAAHKLVINAQNCVHCKTCDIKAPKNYIRWSVPEGGGGPNYENM